jgi:hypothetical protein
MIQVGDIVHTPAYREAYARAQYELDHAYTQVCILGNCTDDWFQGRNIGGIGLVGCPHRQVERRLHGMYRRRMLARKRRHR